MLVALLTTNRRDLPTEVELDETDGLPRACVVNLDNVTREPITSLIAPIARLGPDKMRQVCEALAKATGC